MRKDPQGNQLPSSSPKGVNTAEGIFIDGEGKPGYFETSTTEIYGTEIKISVKRTLKGSEAFENETK